MKKILFLLVLIYNFSFADGVISREEFLADTTASGFSLKVDSSSSNTVYTNTPAIAEIAYGYTNGSSYTDGKRRYWYGGNSATVELPAGSYYKYKKTAWAVYYLLTTESIPCTSRVTTNGDVLGCNSDGLHDIVPNPDTSSNDGQCDDLFVKSGVAYTCNPNTNEASIIPNSNGIKLDENGEDIPNCNSGYDSYSVPNLTVGGSGEAGYNVWGCSAVTSTGDTGTSDSGSSTSTDTGTSSGSGSSSGSSGSTSTDTSTSTGTSGTTSGTSGTSTDTTSSSGGGTGTTSGTGTGSSGTGSSTGTTGTDTGTGTDGTGTTGSDTGTGTTDTSGNPDTNGTDDTGTGNCGDANLTLQEKMLCQLKQGNDLTNSKLGSINTNLTNLNSKFDTANTNLTNINSNIEDSNNILGDIKTGTKTITDFIGTIKELITNPSQIGDKLSNQLSEVAGKFQTDIISNSSCGVCPTISIPYHGSTVTFLSQSLIDNYFPIAIMKTMIILTFAFAGFMNFFRGNN